MNRLPDVNDKPKFVQHGFNEIASRYDLLNDIMTGGLHRGWKNQAVKKAQIPQNGTVLDLCAGTGDLSFRAMPFASKVVALDFSQEMMASGKNRTNNIQANTIQWIGGDATKLPLLNQSFDAALVGFGLRNVASLEQTLAEVLRVLKPGGRFVNLDTANTEWKIFAPFYRLYMSRIVPVMGKLLTGSDSMYQYLSDSAEAFYEPHELQQHFDQAGFINTGYRYCPRLIGGAALVWGEKPGKDLG